MSPVGAGVSLQLPAAGAAAWSEACAATPVHGVGRWTAIQGFIYREVGRASSFSMANAIHFLVHSFTKHLFTTYQLCTKSVVDPG